MARLIQLLTYKAERSAGLLIKADARHTSQDCSAYGVRVAKSLAQRVNTCSVCG